MIPPGDDGNDDPVPEFVRIEVFGTRFEYSGSSNDIDAGFFGLLLQLFCA
jgi:hypothetical protein